MIAPFASSNRSDTNGIVSHCFGGSSAVLARPRRIRWNRWNLRAPAEIRTTSKPRVYHFLLESDVKSALEQRNNMSSYEPGDYIKPISLS